MVRKKKTKLTAEQKKERKLQRHLAKIEAQRQLVKDHLAREIAITNGTYKRAADTWKQMCEDFKIPELKADLNTFWKDLEDVLKHRDETAEKLLYERCQVEDQYQRNAEEYSIILDLFIEINSLFMDAAKKAFNDECNNLLTQFSEECNWRICNFEESTEMCRNAECSVKIVHDHKIEKAENLLLLRKNVSVLENVEKRNIARDTLLDQMEKIYQQMNDVVDTLNVALPKNDLKNLERLDETERIFREEMKKMKDEERKYHREYDDLRMEYQKSHSRFQQKVAELMNEQIYLRKTLSVKKSLALKEEKKDQDLLANLVRESNECIDHLKAQIGKSKHIVEMFDSCRRYQTEEEKILPYPIEYKEVLRDENKFKSSISAIELPNSAFPEVPKMAFFCQKVAKVKSDCMVLQQQKKELEASNKFLQNEFRRFCDCKKYNTTIMNLGLGTSSTVATIPAQTANHVYQVKQTFKK